MKKFCASVLAACIISGTSISSYSMTMGYLSERLRETGCYADSCTYEVLLASLAEPVQYTVGLESSATSPGDTLSPCDYLISWKLPAPSGLSEGFSAYFDGTHFRFRDKRLQEYHAGEDAEPFAPGGNLSRGVQSQAQFTDLLPQFIGARFAEMERDTSYIYNIVADTIVAGRMSTIVEGVRRVNGFDGAEYLYVFDAATLNPLRIELENNPGQIGEQSIVVNYTGNCADFGDCRLTLDRLVARKGEAFEKYRESTFSLESLPGRPLPEISAPTTTGERYFHARGASFAAPTIVAVVDASVGTTPDVVEAVRSAVSALPMQVDVIWAFVNHRADDVDAVMPRPMPGESLLMHAGGVARDCGIGNLTPVLVFADAMGVVQDFIAGYNRDLRSLVIEKASLCGL